MPTYLYLDSARMGLLSERARLAHHDYVRLAASEGCSLYFSQLLLWGFPDWPEHLRRDYPGLQDWQGLDELQTSLRQMIGVPADCQVMLANRTAQLVKLASRRLCENTRRILVTDVMWLRYRRLLEFERAKHRVGISTVSVRRGVRDGTLSMDALVDRFATDYDRMGCDSLFIPVITHDGIRLPVTSICRRLAEIRPLRFVVVDGAQAFGHVPDELGIECCDVFVTGCHKWLQGHVPMGVAYLPEPKSAAKTWSSAMSMMRDTELDDPLLAFSREVLTDEVRHDSETVNLTSLFTCRAALEDHKTSPTDLADTLARRVRNGSLVRELAERAGWSPLQQSMPTGIVMLQSKCPAVREARADLIREFFVALGVSVTAYDGGMIRMSMPSRPFHQGDLDLLAWVLKRCRCEDGDGTWSSTATGSKEAAFRDGQVAEITSSNGFANNSSWFQRCSASATASWSKFIS